MWVPAAGSVMAEHAVEASTTPIGEAILLSYAVKDSNPAAPPEHDAILVIIPDASTWIDLRIAESFQP